MPAELRERRPRNDLEYHLGRARAERDIAYRSADPLAADAHLSLSALHLRRALLLQTVRRAPVGNVRPLRPSHAAAPFAGAPFPELSSCPSRCSIRERG